VKLCAHALHRWEERCAPLGLDLPTELSAAKRPGRKLRDMLAAGWRSHAARGEASGRHYMVSPGGVVFVVATVSGVVVTIVTVADVKRRARSHGGSNDQSID
jgi:hypothetical protein